MKKKITELDTPPKDINSPDSQKFLQKLHDELTELNANFRKEMKKYGVIFNNETK